MDPLICSIEFVSQNVSSRMARLCKSYEEGDGDVCARKKEQFASVCGLHVCCARGIVRPSETYR